MNNKMDQIVSDEVCEKLYEEAGKLIDEDMENTYDWWVKRIYVNGRNDYLICKGREWFEEDEDHVCFATDWYNDTDVEGFTYEVQDYFYEAYQQKYNKF